MRELDRIYDDEARRRATQVLQLNPMAQVKLPAPGESRADLIQWLGHPIRTMTMEEHDRLSDYAEQAREALAKGKNPPPLSPNRR